MDQLYELYARLTKEDWDTAREAVVSVANAYLTANIRDWAVDAEDWTGEISFLLRPLLKKYLDISIVDAKDFRTGDHAIIDMDYFQLEARLVTIRKRLLHVTNRPSLLVLVVFSMGPTLATCFFDVLRKERSSNRPVFVSPERDTDTGEPALKRKRGGGDGGAWWLPDDNDSVAKLENIPRELLHVVYQDAPLHELVKMRRVNKTFQGYMDKGDFWCALLMRDFPRHLNLPGYIELQPLEPSAASETHNVPLSSFTVRSSNAREMFLNSMTLTADIMTRYIHFSEHMLGDIDLEQDVDRPFGLNVWIEGARRIRWTNRVGTEDDWSSSMLAIDKSDSISPGELFLISGQDRSCTQAYRDVLNHYDDAGTPWFHPERTSKLLCTFFRQLLLKTDYREIEVVGQYMRFDALLWDDISGYHSDARHVGQNKPIIEEGDGDQEIVTITIRPTLPGVVFVETGGLVPGHSDNTIRVLSYL